MIAFSKLGAYGRLGNQLFQYAFLRASAERLGTDFYCPAWEGDQIFDLDEQGRRAAAARGILHHFDPSPEGGFTPRALQITDHTDVVGYFQSDRYYADRARVRQWYTFKSSIVGPVDARYPHSLLENACSISLRLDSDYANTREFFPLYPRSYYERGLARAATGGPVLVFADRIDLAKEYVKALAGYEFVFVEGLSPHQQLYLMTRCRANVITNSTFAWWGAWLNQRADRTVVAASDWCRAGVPNGITDILSDEWATVRGTVPVWDHFQLWRLRHWQDTLRRVRARRAAS